MTGTPHPAGPDAAVLDASAAVALLADAGPAGDWVAQIVDGRPLLAPDLLPFQAAAILRRLVLAGTLTAGAAGLAHADLVALPVRFHAYPALADRVWALRNTVGGYDAAYVALAELTGAALVTLDARLARTTGTRCRFLAYRRP